MKNAREKTGSRKANVFVRLCPAQTQCSLTSERQEILRPGAGGRTVREGLAKRDDSLVAGFHAILSRADMCVMRQGICTTDVLARRTVPVAGHN